MAAIFSDSSSDKLAHTIKDVSEGDADAIISLRKED